MASYPHRRDTTWIWVVAGGGLALVAILFALALGGVALIWVIRKPTTAGPSVAGPANPVTAVPATAARDRLIGNWETVIGGRGNGVMELRRDGTMVVTVTHSNGRQMVVTGRWDVVSGSGDRFRFRRITPDSDSTFDIQFSDFNTFTMSTEGGGLIYRRRR